MKKQGFTLIELSIVIVIIGLLVGGILIAKSAIRSAQLQAVATEYQSYASAIRQFQNKYYALPGDFSGATALWGATSPSGNGDGFFSYDLWATNYPLESGYVWNHLGNSGFIDQKYDGNYFGQRSVSFPASKLDGANWNLMSANNTGNYSTGGDQGYVLARTDIDPRFIIALAIGVGFQNESGGVPNDQILSQAPVMTGSEALIIDNKFDDGNGATGKVRAQANTIDKANCASIDNTVPGTYGPNHGVYNTTATTNNCAIAFISEP